MADYDRLTRDVALEIMKTLGCAKVVDWDMAPAWGCSVHPRSRWVRQNFCEHALAKAIEVEGHHGLT